MELNAGDDVGARSVLFTTHTHTHTHITTDQTETAISTTVVVVMGCAGYIAWLNMMSTADSLLVHAYLRCVPCQGICWQEVSVYLPILCEFETKC